MNPRTLILAGVLTLAGVAGTADRAAAQVPFGYGYHTPYYAGGGFPGAGYYNAPAYRAAALANLYGTGYGYGPTVSPYYGGYGYAAPATYQQSYYNYSPFGGTAYRSSYQAPSAFGPGGYRYQYRSWY